MSEEGKITESSGNVFADLGLPDASELLVKAELALQIVKAIEARGLTQVQAAELLGTQQPKVSLLARGELAGFSIERLIRYVNALGLDVEIVVRPRQDADARETVRVAAA